MPATNTAKAKVFYCSDMTEVICPASSVPANVAHGGTNITITGMGKIVQEMVLPRVQREQERTDTSEGDTLQRLLQKVHPSLQWAIKDLVLPTDGGQTIVNKIKDGEGGCISDGSLKYT